MREFLNAKTVVIADAVQQTEIAFEPQKDQEPTLNQPYDSNQFKQAFRTALKDGE